MRHEPTDAMQNGRDVDVGEGEAGEAMEGEDAATSRIELILIGEIRRSELGFCVGVGCHDPGSDFSRSVVSRETQSGEGGGGGGRSWSCLFLFLC